MKIGKVLLGFLVAVGFACPTGRALAEPVDCEGARCAIQADIDAECPCADAKNHGRYTACVARVVNRAAREGTIPKKCRNKINGCFIRSTCGKREGVVLCDQAGDGVSGRCRPLSSEEECTKRGGTVVSSCCDACAPEPTPTITSTEPSPTATPGAPTASAAPATVADAGGAGHDPDRDAWCADRVGRPGDRHTRGAGRDPDRVRRGDRVRGSNGDARDPGPDRDTRRARRDGDRRDARRDGDRRRTGGNRDSGRAGRDRHRRRASRDGHA